MQKAFLHVGCDEPSLRRLPRFFHPPHWKEVRFDINPMVKPDIVGSITDMGMIESAKFDAVFSSHNIEHLYPHEVPPALGEFRRVLNHNGFAVIRCPDLLSVAELIARNGLDTPMYRSPAGPVTPLDALYGFRPRLAEGKTFMAHRTGFTAQTLGAQLIEAGFQRTYVVRAKQNVELRAVACTFQLTDEDLAGLYRSVFETVMR